MIGASGQVGTELVPALWEIYGKENIIAGYRSNLPTGRLLEGILELVDVTNKESIENIVKKYDVDEIYNLAAILSAAGEKNPQLAWNVNMIGHYNVLEVAREYKLRVFWPSTIAVFGPTTPKYNTPQHTIIEPVTMYGITKYAGELLARYYVYKYDLDIRGLRWPGIISSEAMPGGGTTDYAVEMFYYALENKVYECYLREDTMLPMMYMPDAIKSVIQLMSVDKNRLSIYVGYNVTSFSITPKQLEEEIKKYIPEFKVVYKPDYRQKIAESWPRSIDDSVAQAEWGWKPDWDFQAMVKDMLIKIGAKLNKPVQIN